ncbi:MAG TPA: tetratricopeptide repeat protein [Bryobacteraceae bacterium]|nr:tetratricopeptide repeat protein [Bryobacteraceae bacterium]
MSEPVPIDRRSPPEVDRLESWKEIAGYLGREVRTVQGWEKNEGLPIHRHQHARQGSVYAFKSELDAWREARKQSPEETVTSAVPVPAEPRHRPWLGLLVGAAVVLLAGAGFVFWKNHSAPTPGANLSSIVVLPFLDLSPQKDQEYFSDGLTEEIIDALSRVPNLRVVARTSAFSFKGTNNDVRQIGRQLNVDSVLEGSVRKAGDQLRITAQLNRVSDGTHLWSRTYDRQLRDVFAVQREISQAIASQLRAGNVPQRRGTTDLAAYDLYQEGLYFFNQHEIPESYWKAIDRYQKAIQRDPKFALAYSGMADSYAYLAENFAVWPKDVMPKAREAAQKALALDDNLAEAHTSVGIVKLDYDWDPDGAQRELRRALDLNPGSGWVHHWYAHSLEAQGKLDDAMKEMRAALDLDPLSVVIYWDIGDELLMAKRYDDALTLLAKANDLFPNFPIILFEQAEAYYAKGDHAASQRTMQTFKSTHPEMAQDPTLLALMANAEARAGRRAEARQMLDQVEQFHRTRYVEPVMALAVCETLGDRVAVHRWLDRARQERSAFFLYAPLATYFYNDDPEAKAFFSRR